jgi:uncharacterized protein
MAIYRRLFINNIEDLLGRAYPVLRRLHGPERWSLLTQDFYREHGCHTPYFPRLAEEFLDYLTRSGSQAQGDFPFLAELAHYERAEVEVAQQEDGPDTSADDGGRYRPAIPRPESRCLQGRHGCWPMNTRSTASVRTSSRRPLANIRPTWWCSAIATDHVGFIELNALSARMLWYVENDPAPGAELVLRVATDFDLPEDEVLQRSAEELLRHWLQRGVLAGVRTRS